MDSETPKPDAQQIGAVETTGQATRGPIIISRHGRPRLNRNLGPRLDWREYQDWWGRYEISQLDEDQEPPEALKNAVADVDIVLSSTRIRAVETATWATGRKPVEDPIYIEAPLPPPRFKRQKFLPKTWNVLARMAWLVGHSLDDENISQARARAKQAALKLHSEAEGKSVYLAAHGWFNRMMRRPLEKLGWVCVRDGADGYWSYRVYEYRGKS